jgi:hypothetical protein
VALAAPAAKTTRAVRAYADFMHAPASCLPRFCIVATVAVDHDDGIRGDFITVTGAAAAAAVCRHAGASVVR